MIRYRRANHVAWRRVGEETVVVHLERKQMLGLNEAGGRVWQALEGEHDPAAIARGLGDRPEADVAQAVAVFLQELGREGVVEQEGNTEPLAAEPAIAVTGGPAIAWREELRAFGINQCGFAPAQGGPCQGNPHRS